MYKIKDVCIHAIRALNSLSDLGITDIWANCSKTLWHEGKKKICTCHLVYQVGEKVHNCNNAKLSYFETPRLLEK